MKLLKSILLEGPDGGGKTRLHDHMVDIWRLPTSGHDGGPPKSAEECWKRLALFAMSAPCIRDRSPAISDIVYPHAFKRAQQIPQEDYKSFLSTFKPVVIYCRPAIEDIKKVHVKPRPHKSVEHVTQVVELRDQIIETYDETLPELSAECGFDLVIYDWTKDINAGGLLIHLEYISCVAL